MSKQAELEFGDRPGELPLFGPSTAPEPFTVPEFPLEGEPALTPEPEPVSERWTRLLWLLERVSRPATPARYFMGGRRRWAQIQRIMQQCYCVAAVGLHRRGPGCPGGATESES